nr:MAG TPA: hypothetical protein [Caudoviricetes sp.]
MVLLHLYYTIKEYRAQVYYRKILDIFLCILYLSMRHMGLPFFAHKMITHINFGRK